MNTDNKMNRFFSLKGEDVVSAKVSDHHPVIHDGVLFWNVMMQCNRRGIGGFNNGFGLIETEVDYKDRLAKVALVISEAVFFHPEIEVITLCEGPIKSEHCDFLFDALMKFDFMDRFLSAGKFHRPEAEGPNWGLLMLADSQFSVRKVASDRLAEHPKLTNRFQLWKLECALKEKLIALAHFPFAGAGDEHHTLRSSLSAGCLKYCDFVDEMIKRHSEEHFIFCADFNFNPHLVSESPDRLLDKIPHQNSVLLLTEGASVERPVTKAVMVDGVLLSRKEKQRYQSSLLDVGLFRKLVSERSFFKKVFHDILGDEPSLGLSL